MGKKSTVVRVGKDIVDAAKAAGFATVDAYIRHLRERAPTEAAQQPPQSAAPVQPTQSSASAQDKIMSVAADTLAKQVEKAEKTDRTPPQPVVKVQLPPGAVPPPQTWEDKVSEMKRMRDTVPDALGITEQIEDLQLELDKREAQIDELTKALESRKVWYQVVPFLWQMYREVQDLKDIWLIRDADKLGLTPEERDIFKKRMIARQTQPAFGGMYPMLPTGGGTGAETVDPDVQYFEQIVSGWLVQATPQQAQEWLDGKFSIVQILQRPEIHGLVITNKDYALGLMQKLSPDRIIQIISQQNAQLGALLNTERGRRRIEEELEAARRFIEGL